MANVPKKKAARKKAKKTTVSAKSLADVVKKSIPEPEPTPEPEPDPVPEPVQIDRVIRVGKSRRKNAVCPECNAFPTITMIRRKNYELRRCRECGIRFEIEA